MDVRLEGITQKFGALTALDNVSLSVPGGSLHALVGENGAGKTTLMRVLYGALRPDEGKVFLDGQPKFFQNQAEAISAGVGMVSQHYAVIPELSCLQNLMLGAEPGLIIDHSESRSRAEELATRLGVSFHWDEGASMLSPAGAQKLEILKLLWRRAKVMILDEPTAMLSPLDSDALYISLKALASEGSTVIVVTHRLPEVMDHCTDVTVLRGGKNVAVRSVAQTDLNELASLIVGHEMATVHRTPPEFATPLLTLEGLTVKGERGDDAVKGLDLELRAGEMTGLAGVDGNGQRELFSCLAGTLAPASGSLTLEGKDITADGAAARIAFGFRIIPEDRHEEAVVEGWSLAENSALGLQRLPPNAKGGMVDEAGRLALAEKVADRFSTKHAGLDKPMKSLSGGNQQRFVAARSLALNPRVILAFQPTRGLDIDGTAQVYQAIREAVRAGAAALIVSFDLDELLDECDRVVAIHRGHVSSPAKGHEKDRNALGRLMVGAAE